MPKDLGYDPNWWQNARAESLSRRKPQTDKSALAKPGDAFLIVTEGTVAEPYYFTKLRSLLDLSVVHIRVQPGISSDPRQVIETAAQAIKEHAKRAKRNALQINEPAKFDHVFAVVDADVAVRQNHWNDVIQLARARKVQLAYSMPCLEYWLLLHLSYTTRTDLVDGDIAKRTLKHATKTDYGKNADGIHATIDGLVSQWPEAVRRAEKVIQLHEKAGTPIPANPSTEVGRLVRALNDAAVQHQRKL